MLEGVSVRHVDEALRTELRHRLDPDRRVGPDLAFELVPDEIAELVRLGSSRLVFDAGVDVFRVFAEDDDVHFAGLLHRAADTLEIADGPNARVEVEDLTEGDVQ